jgi:hypothetical protein
MPRKISQARVVEKLVKQMRDGLKGRPADTEWLRGWDFCAREVLATLGVPEREPEKGKRHAD